MKLPSALQLCASLYRQIVFSADFLCTNAQEQQSNVRWLADILSRPASKGSNLPNRTYVTGDTQFDRKKFFLLSEIDIDINEKQIFFSSKDIHSDSIDYLKNFFNSDEIYICYELSEATKIILDRAGISYIDIWLHPIRFLDDLLFGFISNDVEINDRLLKWEFPEEIIYAYADRIKVQSYRGFKKYKNHLVPNSALFVGQTLVDKAIASSEGMLNVTHFKDKFIELSQKYDHVYFARHPFVKSGDEDQVSFVKGFRNCSLIENSSYYLVAADEINNVSTISSSLAIEAKYFGKHISTWKEETVPIYTASSYRSVMHHFMFSDFWSSILAGKPKPLSPMNFVSGKDKIRDMLSWYWSYRDVDKLEVIRDTAANAYNRSR